MARVHGKRLIGAVTAAIVVLGVTAGTTGTAAAAASEVVDVVAAADTYVDSSRPDTRLGSSSGLDVDAKPGRIALLRFDLSGLTGRTVLGLQLRMFQVDASKTGGRVRSVGGAWDESTTWSSKPEVGGVLGTFGAVTRARWYELPLPTTLAVDGALSLAVDSASSDGARWASRETSTRPVLWVTVAVEGSADPADPVDPGAPALTQAATWELGSSEPTYYSGQHRLAVTRGGRTLAVYGRHSNGVQLTWRDPGGVWQTTTRGDSTTGALLAGTGTGDWPASIAVATDPGGAEHAWVVWSGPNVGALRPVQMRRLTGLDATEGPSVGPVVTLDAAPRGAYKADIAFERGADGLVRGCVLYSRRVGDTSYELTGVWFTDLTTDAPVLDSRVVLETGTSSSHYGSLVAAPGGLRAVTRAGSGGGSLRVFAHDAGAPLDSWRTGATGPAIVSGGSPSGAALASGGVITSVEHDVSTHAVTVFLVSPDGATGSVLLSESGLAQPTVTTDGVRAWLIAVRLSDGALVSREWSAAGGWGSDQVEVTAGSGGPLAWPNALRQADGRLRVLVEGGGSSSTRSAVLSWDRSL